MLLQLAVYSFPKPKQDLVQLYERLKRRVREQKFEMKDQYLSTAVEALEKDLSSRWRSLWHLLTGKTPPAMPTFFELHDEETGGVRPGRWKRVADKWMEEKGDRSSLPEPWAGP